MNTHVSDAIDDGARRIACVDGAVDIVVAVRGCAIHNITGVCRGVALLFS
jgi:hypothetical protein